MRFPSIAIVAMVVAAATAAGCGDATSAVPVGTVSVQVIDQDNAPVPLVNVDLYKVVEGGALLWRARRTDSEGATVFGVDDGGIEAGDYYVRISFVTGYQLASNETNDKPATVKDGENVSLTFHVTRVSPGR